VLFDGYVMVVGCSGRVAALVAVWRVRRLLGFWGMWLVWCLLDVFERIVVYDV